MTTHRHTASIFDTLARNHPEVVSAFPSADAGRRRPPTPRPSVLPLVLLWFALLDGLLVGSWLLLRDPAPERPPTGAPRLDGPTVPFAAPAAGSHSSSAAGARSELSAQLDPTGVAAQRADASDPRDAVAPPAGPLGTASRSADPGPDPVGSERTAAIPSPAATRRPAANPGAPAVAPSDPSPRTGRNTDAGPAPPTPRPTRSAASTPAATPPLEVPAVPARPTAAPRPARAQDPGLDPVAAETGAQLASATRPAPVIRRARRLPSPPIPVPQGAFDDIEGTVLLRVHIDASGRVASARVLRGLDPVIDDLALAAARTWRYEPARGPHGPLPEEREVALRFGARPAEPPAATSRPGIEPAG